jgi:hypothetical protein
MVHPKKHGEAVPDKAKENRATEEWGFESPNATTQNLTPTFHGLEMCT